MGEVFRAWDSALNRHVALKTMSASLVSEQNLRQRFHREAQSAAQLNHPNIVTVFDFGEDRGKIYMAMELLQGKDLRELIAQRALGNLDWRLDVMDQICNGLAFAHAAEIIHRDLKPGNIHIQPNGNVKIMDFGLARLGASDMTKTGTVMGTPSYMSPEQIRGERTSTRSDVFSLGVIFYELLSYHRPFNADSMHGLLFQVLDRPPEPLIDWAPDVPQHLVDIVDRALSKDPALRYADAGEFRIALGAGMKTISPTATVPGAPIFRSRSARPEQPTALLGGVSGSSALDTRATPPPRSVSVPSMRSRTPTHVSPATVLEQKRQPNFILVLILAVCVVGGGVYLLVKRPWETPPPPAVPQKVTALTQALAASQGELAQRSLDDKVFADAQRRAQEILSFDPNNEQAKQILEKAQASLNAIDAAATEARSALKAGDTNRASLALATLLALDPRHPLATELAGQLNGRFKSQADDARTAMKTASANADKAKASSLKAYEDAMGLQKQAETQYRGEQYTLATGKFLEARDAFDRARRIALAPPVQVPAPPVQPPVVVTPTTLPPLPPPSLAAPTTTLPPPAPVAPVVNEDAAVRQVIADFARAVETKDIALYRAVRPGISAEDEKHLREAFKTIRSQTVTLTIHSVQVDGGRAVVKLSRRDTIDGRSLNAMEQTIQLQKGPAGWAIQQIAQ
jgi:serine/threonine protein kinase/tetratricopeptide (TPR) repeat protein